MSKLQFFSITTFLMVIAIKLDPHEALELGIFWVVVNIINRKGSKDA